MTEMDKKVKEIKELQELIDHRTEVEDQVIELISQCRFEEAQELLSTLDGCADPEPVLELDTGIDGKVTFYKLFCILNKFWIRDFPEYASQSYLSEFSLYDYSEQLSYPRWYMVFFTKGHGKIRFDFYFRLTEKGDLILSVKFVILDTLGGYVWDGGMNFWEEDLLGCGISFAYYQEVLYGEKGQQQEHTA